MVAAPAEVTLAHIARSQHGVFTRGQALESGVSEATITRRVTSGEWLRVDRGVYRHAAVSWSWRHDLMAACLSGGPDALASHRAAAALHRMEGIRPGLVELTAPRWLRRPRNVHLHESQDLSVEDHDLVDGIPCTSPVRTIVDLGGAVRIEVLEAALDDGLRRGLYTLQELDARRRSVARRGRNGVGPLRLLLEERERDTIVAESGFESRLSRLLTRAGFDRPVRQHRVLDRGRLVARLDLSYPELKIGLEADSEAWHMSRVRFIADRTRRNELEAMGWRMLQFTYHHLRHEHEHIFATLARSIAEQRKILEIA